MGDSRPTAPIVVAGDITVDWLTWSRQPAAPVLSPDDGTLNWKRHENTSRVARAGGAMLLARMLAHALPGRSVLAPFDPAMWEPAKAEGFLESFAELSRLQIEKRYTITRLRGFDGPACIEPAGRYIPDVSSNPAVLVLDDAGDGFREHSNDSRGWPAWFQARTPEWVVLKQSRPLGKTGDDGLWDKLRPRRGEASLVRPERLVVIINADDLREHDIKLTPRLSWERTAEDFVRDIGSNGKLVTLTNCRHLLIRFGNEAVIHYGIDHPDQSWLYYDPGRSEGDVVAAAGGQPMVGLTAAFTAAIAADIAEFATFEPNRAIRRAMRASAALAVVGFTNQTDNTPDYNLSAIFDIERKDINTRRVRIPFWRIHTKEFAFWQILGHREYIPELARRIASRGFRKTPVGVPIAEYGKLASGDRAEIESIRAIRNLFQEYIHSDTLKKPLSIAVFGPPGSGKSFTVKQLAEGMLPNDKKRPPLEFNLSQFVGLPHLIGAFHLIQDRILATELPLVFFDEFDSSMDGEALGWLKYFLAPMHDGEFRDGAVTHPLGRAIFVFAGGTRTSFKEFGEPLSLDESNPRRIDFVSAKGPDFLSRLRGHIDIMGISEMADRDDMSWPIRRAIVFRALLEDRARSLVAAGDELAIDDGVLHAFLTIPRFVHGSRSLEAILGMCRLSQQRRFTSSCLPTPAQLAEHVSDVNDFMERVRGERLRKPLRGNLAIRIHDAYRAMRRRRARPEDIADLGRDSSMAPWATLPSDLRESNLQHADAIPRRLRQLGMYMAMYDPTRFADEVRSFNSKQVEDLAEMEHERYVAERLVRGWRPGPRNATAATTPFLVPWCDVPEDYKEYDRDSIRILPHLLNAVGYRVYRVREIE